MNIATPANSTTAVRRHLIVSDLHLGSRFCRREALREWLERLPPETGLVFNGDVVDRVHGRLTAGDRAILARLDEESRRRPVTWIYGNHDDGFMPESPGRIRFAGDLTIERRIYVAHGHGFDAVMPAHRWFIRTFRAMHRLRIALGAEAVHVAVYAKRWERLYRYLRDHVFLNAVRNARDRGCDTVTCGHTHFFEDRTAGGIRYINTGAWTEPTVRGLMVEPDGLAPVILAGEPRSRE